METENQNQQTQKQENFQINQILEQSRQLVEQENFQEAIKLLENSIQQNTNSDSLYYEYGYLLYEIGDFQNSAIALQKSIKLNDNKDPEKFFTLANILNNENSISLYQQGIQIAMNEIKNLQNEEQQKLKRLICLAYCSIYQLKIQSDPFNKEILSYLNQAKEIDPLNLEPYQHILSFYFNQANEQKCREILKEFVQQVQNIQEQQGNLLSNYEPYFFLFFVRILIEGAVWEDAIYLLEVALENDYKNIECYYLLSFCFYYLEEYERAKQEIKTAVDLGILKVEDKELQIAAKELINNIELAQKEQINQIF